MLVSNYARTWQGEIRPAPMMHTFSRCVVLCIAGDFAIVQQKPKMSALFGNLRSLSLQF
jgi:hypothetical protein